jgi:hypothetical protein
MASSSHTRNGAGPYHKGDQDTGDGSDNDDLIDAGHVGQASISCLGTEIADRYSVIRSAQLTGSA